MFLQSLVGNGESEDEAWNAMQKRWPTVTIPRSELQEMATPKVIAAQCANKSLSELKGKLRVSASLAQHLDWIAEDAAHGFDRIFLFPITVQVSPLQFLEVFGQHIPPRLSQIGNGSEVDHG